MLGVVVKDTSWVTLDYGWWLWLGCWFVEDIRGCGIPWLLSALVIVLTVSGCLVIIFSTRIIRRGVLRTISSSTCPLYLMTSLVAL